MNLKLRQIGFSDMLILNKVDLAGPEETTKVRDWIDDTFRRLRIIETSYCEVRLEILLSVGRFDPARSDEDLPTRGGRQPRTQIVAIGAAGSIDTNLLEETFAACITPTAEEAAV
jgi:G3E family GTPase